MDFSEKEIEVVEFRGKKKAIKLVRLKCKECGILRLFYEPVVSLILIELWDFWKAEKRFLGNINIKDLFLFCPKCFEKKYKQDLINIYYPTDVLGYPTLYRFLTNYMKYEEGLRQIISQHSRLLGFSYFEMMKMIEGTVAIIDKKIIKENESSELFDLFIDTIEEKTGKKIRKNGYDLMMEDIEPFLDKP